MTGPGLVAEVEAANTALYAALESADVDAMQALWDEHEPAALVCVHPGWPMLRGRSQILRSWSAVMASTSYIQFFLTDVQVHLTGTVAVVTCVENVLTAITEEASNNAAVVATNVFVRRDGAWRLRLHHGSPVLGRLEEVP